MPQKQAKHKCLGPLVNQQAVNPKNTIDGFTHGLAAAAQICVCTQQLRRLIARHSAAAAGTDVLLSVVHYIVYLYMKEQDACSSRHIC